MTLKCEIPPILQAPRQPPPEEEEDAEEEETEELGHVDTYAEYKPSKCKPSNRTSSDGSFKIKRRAFSHRPPVKQQIISRSFSSRSHNRDFPS